MRILVGESPATSSNRRVLRVWFSRMGQTVAWVLAAVLGLEIVLTVLLPRLIGAEPFTVVSGSMEPAIPTGSFVVSYGS